MSVTYSDVSAVCVPFVFAQLCQELTAVEVEKATIVNLYRDIGKYPEGTPMKRDFKHPWDMTGNDFLRFFYPRQGNFALTCDASSVNVAWQYLSNWVYAPGQGGGFDDGDGGVFDTSFNVVGFVQGQWGDDLNVPADCWSPCSLLRITEELLKANYICNLKCDVCCSLCSYELAQALNSLSNAYNTSSQYQGRDAMRPVTKGDRLQLSILFTNPNTGTNPVDLRMNFQISSPVTANHYCYNSNGALLASAPPAPIEDEDGDNDPNGLEGRPGGGGLAWGTA